jgi:hypothetical protein
MTRYDSATLERLAFRRQFILGPEPVDGFPSWRRMALEPALHLAVHPDLPVSHIADDGRWVALLGYALDPARPAASDVEILRSLAVRFRTTDDLIDATAPLGGRWVLIASDGRRRVLFTDAAGLRQVAYTRGAAPETVWCASQPGLLASVTGAPPDPEASAFVRAIDPTRHIATFWFPGDTTPYAGVRQLLPNHALDLTAGEPSRFWPREALRVVPPREAVARSAAMLQGLVDGASRRFDLMLALTAGWDRRLTLASARAIAPRAFCYTAVQEEKPEDDPDMTTPARLLARLGLPHVLLRGGHAADDEWTDLYQRNVPLAHASIRPLARMLYDHTPADGVCVTGDAGEIPKFFEQLQPLRTGSVGARELARVSRLPDEPFVRHAFDAWLAEARAAAGLVPVTTLFLWEQFVARLQAMFEAESDIARESFAPLNCRRLLETMLAVPERYREEPAFDFFRLLIARLWPQTLVEPINGLPQVGAEARVRRALAHVRVLDLVPGPVKRAAKRLLRRG